jgi:BASS family bile acid:Na+ symporter
MFSFLIRHSLVFIFAAAILGFLLPEYSLNVFPILPYCLFVLMTLTLLGMKQNELVNKLKLSHVWLYALFHSFILMLLSYGFARLIQADDALTLAIVAVAATGSLFATPAIIRALGFDVMTSMAMTIASTILLPLAIYISLIMLQSGDVSLDMQAYIQRLAIFIFGPMLLSYLVHRFVPEEHLGRTLVKISPYTILVVFAFPFGLIGNFRLQWDQDPILAYQLIGIASFLVFLFFSAAFLLYKKQGKEEAFMAAVTAGNRNVLLTYTIAGALLGPMFLPLAGAIQVPTSALPIVTKWLAKRAK